MEITQDIREKLAGILPRNYRTVIAERIDVSENLVYLVLHKGHKNTDVANALLALAQETRDAAQGFIKEVNKL